jgi:hypothetical protein
LGLSAEGKRWERADLATEPTEEGRKGSGFSWAAEKKMAERAKRVGGRGKSFSFSFPIFQSHLPKHFECSFVLEENHSVQKSNAAA